MDFISTLKFSVEQYQQKFHPPMRKQKFLCQTNQWVLLFLKGKCN